MSKIRILGLGGLDEKAKDLYVLEIDSKIFILDSGVFEPFSSLLGINYFIPKIDYLKENIDKVKGIFLSSPNRSMLGAIPQILKLFPKIKVYGSSITIKSLDVFFKDNFYVKKALKNVITEKDSLKIDDILIRVIDLNGSCPGTLGYVFNTKDGNIFYLSSYIFDYIEEYKISIFDHIKKYTIEKNLLLISDSLNMNRNSSIYPLYKISRYIEKYFDEKKRIFITLYEDNIINIIEIIKLAKEYNRQIYIFDLEFLELLKIMIKEQKIPNFPFKKAMDLKSSTLPEEVLIIISGTRSNLYHRIKSSLIEDNIYNLEIEKEDIFIFACEPQPGNEAIFQNITSEVSKIDPKTLILTEKDKIWIHPTQYDLKNYVGLLKPKFIMPVKGYYKEFVEARNILKSIGYKDDQVIIAENGEIYEINDGNNMGILRKIKEVGEQVIEGMNDELIDSEIIKQRQELGKDGLLTIGCIVSKEQKYKVVSNMDIQMRGLIYIKNQEKLMQNLENEIKLIIEENREDFILNRVQSIMVKRINKILRLSIKKIPTIIIKIKQI
ncbi:ribonuclease J [Candidatus Hepatoplasma crinochetorum]|uniref:ribonuclease J n=1 Tax=Candidatus Hepatoplasma crinochetorum TaxID=295596 RepID=UPI00308A5E0D|nr:MAG: RNase J family beta-CASP ribonuclease [Candidatus Hepatoplasma crinochetorum]